MRQIKFRAFNKSLGSLKNWEFLKSMHFSWDFINSNSCNWVAMQYTGLKDSNGTEIYEGDIVLIDYANSEYPTVDNEYHEVIWGGEDYPAFDLSDWHAEVNGLSYLKATGSVPFYVVGNIYQNPELIERT